MTNRILYVVIAACLAGCTSPRALWRASPVTVTKDTAYPHSVQELRAAYQKAIEASELAITAATPSRIEARSTMRGFPATVTIDIGPSDTLESHVHITSTYTMETGAYTNFPYELSFEAWQHLEKRGHALSFPQVVYPAGLERCPASSLSTEEVQRLTPLELIGGLEGLARRATYTKEARAAGVEGRVHISAVVGEEGRVTCAQVDMGLPGGLNEQALAALASSRFKPATLDSKPVAISIAIPITFRLR